MYKRIHILQEAYDVGRYWGVAYVMGPSEEGYDYVRKDVREEVCYRDDELVQFKLFSNFKNTFLYPKIIFN